MAEAIEQARRHLQIPAIDIKESHLCGAAMRYGCMTVDEWVMVAQETNDPDALVLARRAIAESLERGDELSEDIKRYAAKALVTAPPNGKKRGKPTDWWRNSKIIEALNTLDLAGIPPTNEATKDKGEALYGCKIVADILADKNLSKSAVAKIWRTYALKVLWP